MAFIINFTCVRCQAEVSEAAGPQHTHICAKCRVQEQSRRRRVHLAGLKGLTVEERLEKLEAYLYDHDLAARLKAVEAHHVKY